MKMLTKRWLYLLQEELWDGLHKWIEFKKDKIMKIARPHHPRQLYLGK